MTTFEYQILRYMPDRVNGEFVNLGVVVFHSTEQTLRSGFIHKAGRIADIFPGVNSRYLLKVVQAIQIDLDRISHQQTDKLPLERYQNIADITRKILPPDDSALFFTQPEKTLDVNAEVALNYLFNRLVSLHETGEDKEVKLDKDVWTKVYKKHFEAAGISKHLTAHKVKTKFDDFNFEHAWKNGHWNFFEPVTFNLNKIESVKHKVYRWAGQIDGLNTAGEELHLYLLSLLPEKNDELAAFVRELLLSKSNQKVKVELITKEQTDSLVKNLKEEINQHKADE